MEGSEDLRRELRRRIATRARIGRQRRKGVRDGRQQEHQRLREERAEEQVVDGGGRAGEHAVAEEGAAQPVDVPQRAEQVRPDVPRLVVPHEQRARVRARAAVGRAVAREHVAAPRVPRRQLDVVQQHHRRRRRRAVEVELAVLEVEQLPALGVRRRAEAERRELAPRRRRRLGRARRRQPGDVAGAVGRHPRVLCTPRLA